MSLALQTPLAVIPEMKLKKKKKDILIYWSQIVFINCKAKAKIAQLCPTLCDSMDYTVHGILQVRILEWVAVPFSRESSQPRDQTPIAGGFFTSWATKEAQEYWRGSLSLLQWIFLTHELNQGLLHCRQILYQLSYQGSHQLQSTC